MGDATEGAIVTHPEVEAEEDIEVEHMADGGLEVS